MTKNKIESKKVRSNLISIFLINTVVLFTLSLIGFIYLKSTSVESYFKENVLVNIYLKNNTKDFENKQLIKFLNLNDDVKQITYLSKEDAAKTFSKEIGEEFVGFLGYNPLLDAISVQLYSDKIDVYSIEKFIENINDFEFIEEVEYDKPLVNALNTNFEKMGLWIFILSVIFFLTSFILINNSIKISIYSKREIIKTMQLVGATSKFIRKPFIWSGIKLGFIGAFISLAGLAAVIYYIDQKIPTLQLITDYHTLVYLGCGILLIAFIISWLSTFFATQRFLNLQTDELYF